MQNKKFIVAAAFVVVVGILVLGWMYAQSPEAANATPQTQNIPAEKVYVALEGEGKVAVVDASTRSVITNIDLTEETSQGKVHYMAHNVQVAPDGSKILVTANVNEATSSMPASGMDMSGAGSPDELIIIDPKTDTILSRIPIDKESHLAHVVMKDGKTAYINLQGKDMLDVVDIAQGTVTKQINLGAKSGPHGLRLTPDGKTAVVALLGGKGVAFVDTSTGKVRVEKVPGSVVQTAVTADGMYAFGSVYETKQVAWFSLTSNEKGVINLPVGAKGPVQLYSTPDSRYLYVADQGYYFDQPRGSTVYRIDIAQKSVDQTIAGGDAPHGVVVDKAGAFAYVTNLLGNDLSVIEVASGKEVARIPVGAMPNGVSVWSATTGGTQ